MEIFLIVSSLIFLVFGSMLLLAPETIEKISKITSQGMFFIDERVHAWRRPIGIFFLVLCIFLWYVAWWKGKLQKEESMFRRKGFTLIELIIVIAVISILIGIALPRFRGMQEAGYIAQAKGELRTLQTAVESYYIHNSEALPGTLAALTSTTPNIVGTAIPTDPFTSGSNYGYATTGSYYVIYSAGAGGNGSAAVSSAGVVTETNGSSCIFVTNGTPRDAQP